MKKTTALKIVNPVIAVLFVNQALSGIFHASIPYELFERGHGWGGYVFAALVVVHVVLNWSWVRSVLLKGRTKN